MTDGFGTRNVSQAITVKVSRPGDRSHVLKESIHLHDSRGSVCRNGAIAVTPDSALHPFWIEPGNATRGIEEVADEVAVLHSGNQFYDTQTGLW
jgi:hypothetical protein